MLILLLVFGSAATFMFWAKWLGKLAGIAGTPDNVERGVHPSEWVATTVMVCLVVAVCALLPLLSEYAVEPYVAGVFGTGLQTLSDDNLWISSLCCIVLAVVLIAGIGGSGKARKVDVYMSGVSVNDANREYRDSLSGVTKATARNLYLESMFGEKIWSSTGSAVAVVLILVAFIAASAPVFGLM